jgi:hypothetical protein
MDSSTDDLPAELFGSFGVQPSPKKDFASPLGKISSMSAPVPHPQEGRFAIVTNVGGGMRWTHLRARTKHADADGEAVWS